MLLGITPNQKNEAARWAKKSLSIATVFGLLMLFLPFIVSGIFHLVGPEPSYGSIEAPVARVETATGTGTAFLVSPNQMMTARHVVEDVSLGDTITVVFEQAKTVLTRQASVTWKAPTQVQVTSQNTAPLEYFLTDAALLTLLEPVNEITPLVLGISEEVSNLEEVILIGYPSGDYSISEGNINSIRYQNEELFKLDATSNPGNSGGPCLRKDDNTVIGILVGGPSNPLVDGENLAIKIDDVLKLLGQAGVVLFQ